jgi:Fe-S oxidoreductase
MKRSNLKVPTMAEMAGRGEAPEILSGLAVPVVFDSRAQKITRAVVKILNHCNISFAVLGTEESCNGDPAKRERK